jgi:hypothetical protein
LEVQEPAVLPTELAIAALQNSTENVFCQWVTGSFPHPELTSANLEAVLRPDGGDTTAVLSPFPGLTPGRPNNARRVLRASDELAARGFGAFVTATDGVPRELLIHSMRDPHRESHTANYAATEMASLLSLAGPALAQYLLETVANWEGSFDGLRALLLAVRPD